ncbi:MAG: class I SAM-dependent methyltransferase [Synechococcaceae cyanobacterium ELA739]
MPKRSPVHAACPVCGSSQLRRRFGVDGFDISRCSSCSLQFVLQRLTDQELAPYYQVSDSVYEDSSNVENLAYYSRRLKHLLERRFPSGGRLLDVGCSRGQFIDVMTSWDAYGIELSTTDASFARLKHGPRIHQGTLANFPEPNEGFDVITLLDTFDHMPAPHQVLARCRSLLRPNGCIVIKVHDISCLYARLTGRNFYAILPPYHLFYYSQKTLAHLFKNTGFELDYTSHIGHRLFLKTIPYRLARGKSEGFFYSAYRILESLPIGRLKIHKNLNDIITAFAHLGHDPIDKTADWEP